MRSRFFLLDINEDRSVSEPTVRLWGLDDNGERVLIKSDELNPYFYYLPEEGENLDLARERLEKERARFPGIQRIDVETKKLLGRPRNTLKLVCSEADLLSKHAKAIRKLLGAGACYEDDLRLSVRYLTDTDLTPCAWHEIDVEPAERGDMEVHRAFAAKSLPKKIEETTAVPKMRMLAFSVLTAGEQGSANPAKDPIRVIAIATNNGPAEVIVNQGEDDSTLLSDFVSRFKKYDPDVVIGFETNASAWPYVMRRCKLLKFRLALGRDGSEPHTSLFGHVSLAGRANLDLSDVAGGIQEIKVKTVESFAKFLHVPTVDKAKTIDETERYPLWVSVTERQKLIETWKDNVEVLLDLAKTAINFPIQLSALTGLPLDQVMTAAVGFRVDSYLVKQAHRLGELVPRRVEQPYFTYRGAIVLEPKTGIHESVVVLDFSAMYPSLMEKYNLSPDTLVGPGDKVDRDSVFNVPEVNHRFRKQPDGFYRIVLKKLIEERERVKNEVREACQESARYRVLKERERAVKIITNACYGYAGWAGARWYAKEVAESAAALGRDTITKTIEKANSIGLSVIYGDTDSIFVNDDRQKVDELVKWVKSGFDLEIKREREYVRVLFTEAMKRYAGLMKDDSLDIVGLEAIRGDWSDIAREVQNRVLIRVLRDQSTEKAVEDVRTTIRQLKAGEVPIASLTIRKGLAKPIEDYRVRTPHVEVAKLLVKQGWDLGVGDKVAYVIVDGPGKLFQKARPLAKLGPKDIDVEYYVENQIKPAAMRILERFGVDEKQLAA